MTEKFNRGPDIVLTKLLVRMLILAFLFAGCSHNLKNRDELLSFKNAEASLVLSEEGELLGKYFYENRTTISSDQIPGNLINALIATEDARFYEHKGTDTRSYLRVLFKTIVMRDKASGGGSTITQQLAKSMLGRKKGSAFSIVFSKLKEAILAHRLEKVFNKQEILNLYLNTVSFGENVYGIEAASLRYFSKTTRFLRTEESAVLVGMLKANTFYNPRLHPENARNRRNVVLRQMEKYKYLKKPESDSLSGLPMVINYRSESSGPADYFLSKVRKDTDKILRDLNERKGEKWDVERDGLIISTTLNSSLQKYAMESFREHLQVMQKKLKEQYLTKSGKDILEKVTENEIERLNLASRANETRYMENFEWSGNYLDSLSVRDSLKRSLIILHAGFLAIDPQTGEIKAWVGGVDFKTQPYDQILARRQLASVFKPVLYAAALEQGIEPCHYLDNDSIRFAGYDDWNPENFDHSFGGKYSMSGALVHSMNIPTLSLFLEIGFPIVDTIWKRMGFSFTVANTPSFPMGTAEANIEEVAVAYSSFANGGYRTFPFAISSIKSPKGEIIYQRDTTEGMVRILSDRSSLLMNAMLQKAIREGTGVSINSIYGIKLPLAGKTGTSQDYSDAWFAVYNPKIVIVTRVGASSRAVHFNSGINGSGSALALPLAALTLKKLESDPYLTAQFVSPFPELPGELANALDCPDFRDKSFFDRIIDIFEKDKKEFDKNGTRTERRIKSFLKKIFRKKSDPVI